MFRLTGHLRMSYCEAGWTGTVPLLLAVKHTPNPYLYSCVLIIVFRLLEFPFFARTP
jgi:hypothetical protein